MFTNPCHLEIAREVARMLSVSEDDACAMVGEVPEVITQLEEGITSAQDAACHVVCMWADANMSMNMTLELSEKF